MNKISYEEYLEKNLEGYAKLTNNITISEDVPNWMPVNSNYVGAVVASMNNDSNVTNCYVTNTTVKGGNYVGTLVGYYNENNDSIENSYYL